MLGCLSNMHIGITLPLLWQFWSNQFHLFASWCTQIVYTQCRPWGHTNTHWVCQRRTHSLSFPVFDCECVAVCVPCSINVKVNAVSTDLGQLSSRARSWVKVCIARVRECVWVLHKIYSNTRQTIRVKNRMPDENANMHIHIYTHVFIYRYVLLSYCCIIETINFPHNKALGIQ